MANPLRVVVVEDHQLLLDMLVSALDNVEDLEVVATASSVQAFLSELSQLPISPDVVVTDIDLGGRSGREVAAHTRLDTSAEVLIMTGNSAEDGVRLALETGAGGFISKTAPLAEFVSAVRNVGRGTAVFPSDLLRAYLQDDMPEATEPLTNREQEVLEALAAGQPISEISTALHISTNTARNHVKAILLKLGASSQLEAVVKGVRSGIVEIR